MSVITVSREFGAGGLIVGRDVASRLGSDFLDSALVEEVARRMQCSEDEVRRWDERGEGLILRLLRALRSAHPEFATPGPVGQELIGSEPHPDRVMARVKEVIREEARDRDAVIVGRGGAFILADRPDALHIRLIAEREDRAHRLAERNSWSFDQALEKTDEADRERAAYIKHHFGVEWSDPHHYSLVLNTSRVSFDQAAEIISGLARTQGSG